MTKSNRLRAGVMATALILAAILLMALVVGQQAKPAQGQSSGDPSEETTASAGTVERSFDEWLAAQGTFCVPDGSGGCFLFFPPLPNMLGWEDNDSGTCALVDYAGLANQYIKQQSGGAIDLGTTVTGTVKERALNDGRSEITVRLQFTNALAFAVAGCDITSGPLIFGYRTQEVLAGATPSLANGSIVFKYTTPLPGSPQGGYHPQDLIEVVFFPQVGQDLAYVNFNADADGHLREASGFPDGTLGTLSIKELALFKPKGRAGEPFVVHRIDVKPQ
jgi:hypothetical protein